MCITSLDNWGQLVGVFMKKARKVVTFLVGVGVSCVLAGGSGCRNNSQEPGQERPASSKMSTSDRISEADAFYRQRKDLSNARRAIISLKQARISEAGNYEAAWKLAKAEYYLGTHAKDDAEREAAFRDGIEAGKAAVQLQDNKPDGHFWLGANYGGSAEMSILASLSSIQDIRGQMEKVLQLDEGYEGGSAYLALGQLYLKAPRVLGGDSKKAVEYLEKGLRFGPDNALLRLRLAEAYHAVGRDGDARKQIENIRKLVPTPDYAPEYDDAVAGANELERRIQ